MTTAPHDADKRVVETITNAINELQTIGASEATAVRLLLNQAVLRMPSRAATWQALAWYFGSGEG